MRSCRCELSRNVKFIANRLGLFGMEHIFQGGEIFILFLLDMTIELIDHLAKCWFIVWLVGGQSLKDVQKDFDLMSV